MRLLTWNLCGGGAASEWPTLARALASDAILLQETPAPDGGGTSLWRPVPSYRWGSAVAVTSGALTEVPLDAYEGWVIGGEWTGAPTLPSNHRCFIFSVHSPSKTGRVDGDSYVEESLAIVRAILAAVPSDATLVIGGDFNFTSLGERLAHEEIQTTREEREALGALESLGLAPAWQAAHPGRALPQTLRWTGDRRKPYHCDGFLLQQGVLDRTLCEVLSAPHLDSASDHAPVAAWVL